MYLSTSYAICIMYVLSGEGLENWVLSGENDARLNILEVISLLSRPDRL